MSRPRTPESELLPGSLEHNKARYAKRATEPKVAGQLGKPSRWLSKEQKTIWNKLVRNSPSVLGESDRTLLEIAVVLKSKLETGAIENSQITQLLRCLDKLGMIPYLRVAVPEPKAKTAEEEAWDEI